MAATVNDLIAVWEVKVGGYKNSLPTEVQDRVNLLNAAKHMVWLALVAAGRAPAGIGNWFAKSTTLAYLSTEREKDLPSDFHDILFVEPTTATWEEVAFEGLDFYKDVFQNNRRSATAVVPADGTRYYVVAGDQPAKLLIDRKCTGGITLQIWYTSILPEWTAVGDSVTRLPTPYQDAVVNLAAMMTAMSKQDAAIAGIWKSLWDENKALLGAVAGKRQSGSVFGPKTYDNKA